MATYCPQILKHLNHLWHIFPHNWPSTQFQVFTCKNSPSLCLPLLSCLMLIGFPLCHLSSELLWQEPPNCFLCFEIIPSSPYPPRAFRFQSCFMKTKIVSSHFPIFKPFLNVLCTFEVAKTSAGATHKQVIPEKRREKKRREGKRGRWRMVGTSIKNLPNYSASVLWEQTSMFCQNFYLFFSHQKLEILIFIEGLLFLKYWLLFWNRFARQIVSVGQFDTCCFVLNLPSFVSMTNSYSSTRTQIERPLICKTFSNPSRN